MVERIARALSKGTAALLLAVALASCARQPEANANLNPKTEAKMKVTSSAISPEQPIPARNTAEGGNVSPDVSWSGEPEGTKSVTLIVDDPDANGFVHWVVYNIPPHAGKLPSGLPLGQLKNIGAAMQGQNQHGDEGYYGPKPPPGNPHHYRFHLYALDQELPLKPDASKDDVVKAMSGHVLAEGEMVGIYQSG